MYGNPWGFIDRTEGAHRRVEKRVGSMSHLRGHSRGAAGAIAALVLDTPEAAAAVTSTPIVVVFLLLKPWRECWILRLRPHHYHLAVRWGVIKRSALAMGGSPGVGCAFPPSHI